MRWTIASTLGLTGAVFAALTAVPVHADPAAVPGPDQYINELRDAGFHVDGDKRMTVLTLGLGACVDLFNGFTRQGELEKLMQLGGYQNEAATLLRAAQRDLCPKTLSLTNGTGAIRGATRVTNNFAPDVSRSPNCSIYIAGRTECASLPVIPAG